MALVFPGNFYLVGVTPQTAQFELDRLTRHWKTNGATEEEVLSCPTLPQKGDVHPLFPFMFVTDFSVQETAEKACALDVRYMGVFAKDSFGNPIMPPAQNEGDDAVQTATSRKASTGTILAEPLTLQYYAPTTQAKFFTYGAKGTRGTIPDPVDDIRVITLTCNDTTFSPTGSLSDIANLYFTPLIIDTIKTPEVVAGKFWQNTEKKTKSLSPWIFSFTTGNYILMFSPGIGYTVGNVLTINDGMGHVATISVVSVGLSNSITNYATLTNTFNYTTTSGPPLYASGGSGTGAAFYNVHVP